MSLLAFNLIAKTADECGSKFLGVIPTWYQYLPEFDDSCGVVLDIKSNPESLWLIGLAILNILLTIAGMIAVIFVMYGGFRFITSQGEPENVKAARNSILNALIGLAITVLAATVVSFIAGSIN